MSPESPHSGRQNEQIKQVLSFARYESFTLNSPEIKPEHLFLGMIREDNRLGGQFLRLSAASTSSIRRQIETFANIESGSGVVSPPFIEGMRDGVQMR